MFTFLNSVVYVFYHTTKKANMYSFLFYSQNKKPKLQKRTNKLCDKRFAEEER